jgi:hypothetical protein
MSGTLRVQLAPSRRIAAALLAAHMLAGASLWVSPLPAWAALTLIAMLAAHAAISVRRHAFLDADGALLELELRDDGTLSACTREGRWLACELVGSGFVSSAFTAITLRADGERRVRSVLIAADCMERDAFRRLRVWLRWRGSGNAGSNDPAVQA